MFLSHLRYMNLISSPVEDGSIVFEVHNSCIKNPVRLTLYDFSHLRYRNLVASPVEDGSIVVDVLNFDRNGADALQRGSTAIACLHNIRIT
jgi:hypothetical protein